MTVYIVFMKKTKNMLILTLLGLFLLGGNSIAEENDRVARLKERLQFRLNNLERNRPVQRAEPQQVQPQQVRPVRKVKKVREEVKDAAAARRKAFNERVKKSAEEAHSKMTFHGVKKKPKKPRKRRITVINNENVIDRIINDFFKVFR